MTEFPKPKFTYVVATVGKETHWVMVVHDDSIDWYRRIATFTSRKRADDYADLENTFAADSFGEPGWRDEYNAEDNKPAPTDVQAKAPPSAVAKATEIVRVVAEEQVRAAAAVAFTKMPPVCEVVVSPDTYELLQNAPRPSEPVAATPEPVSEPCQGDVASGNPLPMPEVMAAPGPVEDGERSRDEGHISEEGAGHTEEAVASDQAGSPVPTLSDDAKPNSVSAKPNSVTKVHVSTLKPLSEKQAKVFRVLSAASGGMTNTELCQATGYTNVHDALTGLKNKRYATRVGHGYPERWITTAEGEPAIDQSIRVWTPLELEDLATVCEQGGDMAAYAVRIGRTPAAVEQMARARRWYPEWERVRREAGAAVNHSAAIVPVKPVVPAKPAPPPVEDDNDETVTLNDLTLRQVAVLKALCREPFRGMPTLAASSGVEQKDLPLMLARLRSLKLIGETSPTEAGRALYAKALALGPETKISFPVVRRPPIAEPATKPVNNSSTPQPPAYKAVEYLRKKGHRVVLNSWKNEWNVDGRVLPEDEVLDLINEHRIKAETPALASIAALT